MGIDFSSITLPFSAPDLLSTAMGLLGVLGPFVLLAMAFPLGRKLISILSGSIGNGGKKS